MALNITVPQQKIVKPKISVFGIGGAGGNALNNMISANLEGVEFIASNTDAQSLQNSLAKNKIQLGIKTTKGLGAGSFPDKGKAAAEENIEEINRYLEGNNMVFITAGMGGGTGTGAAPVIAKLSKEKDILTVAVVTKPFDFEGKYRMNAALKGIEDLKKHVDTLIIIPNQNLFRIANETTTFEAAFKMADNVLHAGVRGVTDLITMPGLVNLDFADIKTIMTKMGKAMMGTGEAEGENRAVIACREAISNPLLDDVSIKGARGVLVNMTGGSDMTLFEADQAVNEIRKEVDGNANIIFGSAFNDGMKGKIRVSVVATGIGAQEYIDRQEEQSQNNKLESPKEEKTFFNPSEIQNISEDPAKISPKNFKPNVNIDNFINEEHDVKVDHNQTNNYSTNNSQGNKNLANNQNNISNNLANSQIKSTNNTNQDNSNITEDNLKKAQESIEEKLKKFETVTSNDFTPSEEENAVLEEDFKFEDEFNTPAKEDKKENKSKFNLFGFMSGNKKGKKQIDEDNGDIIDVDENNNDMQEKEVLDFSFHDDEMEDIPSASTSQNSNSEDDEVLNIPTFFRKKK